MSEFYRNRRIERTRKEHRCYDCGKTIPKGSTCAYSVSNFDGSFHFGHFCSGCVILPEKNAVGEERT